MTIIYYHQCRRHHRRLGAAVTTAKYTDLDHLNVSVSVKSLDFFGHLQLWGQFELLHSSWPYGKYRVRVVRRKGTTRICTRSTTHVTVKMRTSPKLVFVLNLIREQTYEKKETITSVV